MRLSTLIRVLLATAALWAVLLGSSIRNDWRILELAPGYRAAELVVADASCVRDTSYDAGSRRRRDGPIRYCSLDGTVEGESASLDITSAPHELPYSVAGLRERYPPGSRIRVLYHPNAPRFGINYRSIAVLWWTEDLESDLRWRIAGSLRMVAFSLGSVVAIFVAAVVGRRLRSGEDGSRLEMDQGRPWEGWGLGVAGFGLALILAQIEGVTVATAVSGSAIALVGGVLLLRRWSRVEQNAAVVTRGHHLFGFPVWSRKERLGTPVAVSLTGDLPPHLELRSASDDASVVVLKSRSSEEARREGERVARFLKTTLQDPFRERREELKPA